MHVSPVRYFTHTSFPGGFIAPLTRVGKEFPRTPLGVAIRGMSVDVTQAETLNVLAWLALAFPPFPMSRTGPLWQLVLKGDT